MLTKKNSTKNAGKFFFHLLPSLSRFYFPIFSCKKHCICVSVVVVHCENFSFDLIVLLPFRVRENKTHDGEIVHGRP